MRIELHRRVLCRPSDLWPRIGDPVWIGSVCDRLKIEPLDDEPPAVGTRYRAQLGVGPVPVGGNIEIISWLLQAGMILPNEAYDGCVLYLETSEEMPSAEEVFRTLRNMGERGLLQRFAALLMGRPKAWERDHQTTAEQKRRYIADQHRAVLRAMETYHPDAMVVFDVDFGHTDPQLIIPNGGDIRLDGPSRRIEVRY